MANLLFLHAHPDDEAIFTGGTAARLVKEGHEVTVIFATDGSLGLEVEDENLADVRRKEAQASAEILGISHVKFLGYSDSGLDPKNFPPNAFTQCDAGEAANQIAEIIKEREINVLFFDDENGIYGHPDHRKSHQVGCLAWDMFPELAAYAFTVDREYLHFCETRHLVQQAFNPYDLSEEELKLVHAEKGWQHSALGVETLLVENEVIINGGHLRQKFDAMEAHQSQIKPDSETMQLPDEERIEIYGREWFMRLRDAVDNPIHNPDNPFARLLDEISSHPLFWDR